MAEGKGPSPDRTTVDSQGFDLTPGRPRQLQLPRPGERLSRYQIVAELARGGMGVVLQGVDVELQRPVAVKVLAADAPDAETVERFKVEARVMARLEHPHILSVLDAGVDAGRPFLVMPLVEGESLRQLVERLGPLGTQAALEVGVALADAVAYAHQQGVLHRDLKPQNVLVEPSGRVLVTDFGMARMLEAPADSSTTLVRLTVDGQVLGTPAYMPPEQARGDVDQVDARSDVYGLGAVLYAAVTGQAPASGVTPAQVLRAAVSKEPPPLTQLRPDLPGSLSAVIHRCLAKEPADRFQSADAALAALRACQGLGGSALAGAAVVRPPRAGAAPGPGSFPGVPPPGSTTLNVVSPVPSASVTLPPPSAASLTPSHQAVIRPPQGGSRLEASSATLGRSPTRLGPYEILEELSCGAQGRVVRARHTELGREVALKILLDPSERARKRFKREIRVLANLRHPHLPQAFDVGEAGGYPFIAIELIRGGSLRDRVTRQGVPPFAWSAQVLETLARALHHCHQQGALHRDIKPGNVVIEEGTERPVLVDFGLVQVDPDAPITAETVNSLSLTGELVGTPAYMSPEQAGDAKRGPVSVRSDVYGLGATLYTLLTGVPPFAGGVVSVIYQVLEGAAPDPRAHDPQVPAALASVCLRAMAKDPAQRFPSAEAFADALAAAVGGASDAQVAERPSSGRMVLPVAFAVVALAVAGLIVFLPGSKDDPLPPVAHASAEPAGASSAPPTSPRASSAETPAPNPEPAALPAALPVGSRRWRWEVEGETLSVSNRSAGPFVIVRCLEAGWVAVDTRDAGGTVIRLPGEMHHCFWDGPRQRLLALVGDPLRMVGVDMQGAFEDFGRVGARRLVAGPNRLYFAADRRLVAVDASDSKRRIWKSPLPGRVDHDPLLLDFDGDGLPDRVLLADCANRALLFDTRNGQPLATLSLPGPVRYAPQILSQRTGTASVLVACSDGNLVRLRVTPHALELSGEHDLGVAPTTEALVLRDAAGAPTQIVVASERLGLTSLTPELDAVLWASGPPAPPGLVPFPRGDTVAVDLDRDGQTEIACFWKHPSASAVQLWVFDDQGRPRVGLDGERALRVPDAGLVSSTGARVTAWGPWEGLGEPYPLDRERVLRALSAGLWSRVLDEATQLGDEGVPLVALAQRAMGRPSEFSVEQLRPIVQWILRSRRLPTPLAERLLALVGRGRPPFSPKARPLPSAGPWEDGPPLGARFDLSAPEAPPVVNGLELSTESNLRQAYWLSPGEALSARFSLESPGPCSLLLKHRAIESFDWGFSSIQIELDGQVVVEAWAPSAEEHLRERFRLGELRAGEHTVAIRVGKVSPTPYEVEELSLDRR